MFLKRVAKGQLLEKGSTHLLWEKMSRRGFWLVNTILHPELQLSLSLLAVKEVIFDWSWL